MIKFLGHRMKFHKLSRWHEVINQLLHLWNSRSNYPKNAEGESRSMKRAKILVISDRRAVCKQLCDV